MPSTFKLVAIIQFRMVPELHRPSRASTVNWPIPGAAPAGPGRSRWQVPGSPGLLDRQKVARSLDDGNWSPWSPRGSRQIAQRGWFASARWEQTWQWRIALGPRIASASSIASSGWQLQQVVGQPLGRLRPGSPAAARRAAASRSTAAEKPPFQGLPPDAAGVTAAHGESHGQRQPASQ